MFRRMKRLMNTVRRKMRNGSFWSASQNLIFITCRKAGAVIISAESVIRNRLLNWRCFRLLPEDGGRGCWLWFLLLPEFCFIAGNMRGGRSLWFMWSRKFPLSLRLMQAGVQTARKSPNPSLLRTRHLKKRLLRQMREKAASIRRTS